MIGDSDEMNQIYLLDFGISSTYLNKFGVHRPQLSHVPFKGNVIFASKNAFDRITLSRRDDIIALAYMLSYLIDTNIKWYHNGKPKKD